MKKIFEFIKKAYKALSYKSLSHYMREAIEAKVREDRKKMKAFQRSAAMEQIGCGTYENHFESLEEKSEKIGDIVWVNLDPTVGDEMKKKRPVVVLNNGHGKHLRLAIVVPVTQWNCLWESNPFFVSLDPSKVNGLKRKSAVDCFQIRAVSHQRILDHFGSVTPLELAQIKKSLALILDLEPEDCE